MDLADFEISFKAIEILWKSLEVRGMSLCPERGYIAHAKALVLREVSKKSVKSLEFKFRS